MCIYCNTKNYRKIYVNHHGPILKEPNGRSYEIHHIDGNHSNNIPENLTLVTLQEHYNIHYQQKDYGACYLIAQRLKKTPTEISELSKKIARQRIQQGTHHWQNSDLQRKKALDAIANKEHSSQIEWCCLGCKTTGKGLGNYSRFHGNNCKVFVPRIPLPKETCPHCGIKCSKQTLIQWHGDKCKAIQYC